MDTLDPYRPVRALQRGIAILQELNRVGAARPADLARATGLDRTTTYRLLATLEREGLVKHQESNDDYVLTSGVRALSEGFTERDRTTQIVGAHLGTLFQRVLWPTDFATYERGVMIIRDTTHRFSPYSVHRAMIGRSRPLLTSALGRAALAGATERERIVLLEIYRGANPEGPIEERAIQAQIDQILDDHAKRGYSWSVGGSERHISAIALSVSHAGAAASINLVFFRSTMSIETAAARHLDHMKLCVAEISAGLQAHAAGETAAPNPDGLSEAGHAA